MRFTPHRAFVRGARLRASCVSCGGGLRDGELPGMRCGTGSWLGCAAGWRTAGGAGAVSAGAQRPVGHAGTAWGWGRRAGRCARACRSRCAHLWCGACGGCPGSPGSFGPEIGLPSHASRAPHERCRSSAGEGGSSWGQRLGWRPGDLAGRLGGLRGCRQPPRTPGPAERVDSPAGTRPERRDSPGARGLARSTRTRPEHRDPPGCRSSSCWGRRGRRATARAEHGTGVVDVRFVRRLERTSATPVTCSAPAVGAAGSRAWGVTEVCRPRTASRRPVGQREPVGERRDTPHHAAGRDHHRSAPHFPPCSAPVPGHVRTCRPPRGGVWR